MDEPLYPFSYRWTINNFTFLTSDAIIGCPHLEALVPCYDVTLHFWIYPKGWSDDENIQIVISSGHYQILGKVWIENQEGTQLWSQEIVGDRKYELTIPKNILQLSSTSPNYTFYINGIAWQEPEFDYKANTEAIHSQMSTASVQQSNFNFQPPNQNETPFTQEWTIADFANPTVNQFETIVNFCPGTVFRFEMKKYYEDSLDWFLTMEKCQKEKMLFYWKVILFDQKGEVFNSISRTEIFKPGTRFNNEYFVKLCDILDEDSTVLNNGDLKIKIKMLEIEDESIENWKISRDHILNYRNVYSSFRCYSEHTV